MPGPCLVMVFREGTGHWTETLFYPWLLLLETKWDSQRAWWRRQVNWRQSCDRSQLSLAPLVGNFTARHFLHLHPGPYLCFYKLPFLFPVPTALLPPVPLCSPVSGPCHLELHFLPVPHIFPWFHSQSQQVGPTFVFSAAMSMCPITDILAWGSPRFTQFHSKALLLTYWWLSRVGAAAACIPDTQGEQELAHTFRNFHGPLRNCWSFEIGGQWEVLFRCNWTTITNQSFYFLRAGSSICPCMNSPYLLEAVQMKCHQTLPKAAGQDQSWKWSGGGGGASYFLYRQGLPILFFLFVLIKFYFSFECLNLCLWPATHFLFE